METHVAWRYALDIRVLSDALQVRAAGALVGHAVYYRGRREHGQTSLWAILGWRPGGSVRYCMVFRRRSSLHILAPFGTGKGQELQASSSKGSRIHTPKASPGYADSG